MRPLSSREILEHYGKGAEEASLLRRSQAPDLTPSARYVIREARKKLSLLRDRGELPTDVSEEVISQIVHSVEEVEGESLSDRERTAAIAALDSSLLDFDILTPLLENPELNDIIIRAFDDISVQKGRANIQTDLRFSDAQSYKGFVENLLKRVGKACTTGTPVIDAALTPEIRICVTHESFSPAGSGPMMTIRLARHRGVSVDTLAAHELAPREVFDYLLTVIGQGSGTVLIAGEVGTGKTTLVRALSAGIPEFESILVIEDTHEIMLERRFVRTLLTREANAEGAGRIPPAQAIRTGMRMAMNRVILGEMRDSEAAEAFIDVCSSGHPGMSTIHARSARDALGRLELFLTRVQGNIGVEAIRKQIANAVSVVVYLGLDPSDRKRRIKEIVEVNSAGDGALQISPLFSTCSTPHGVRWRREGGVSAFQDALRSAGVVLPRPGELLRCGGPEHQPSIAFRDPQ